MSQNKTVTPGMAKAMKGDRSCSGCGLSIPTYPGRYPAKCPSCDTKLDGLSRADSITQTLEALTGKAVKELTAFLAGKLTSKATTFAGLKKIKRADLEPFGKIPTHQADRLYGLADADYAKKVSPSRQKFRTTPKSNVFIIKLQKKMGGNSFIVDTSGYDYARYIAEIVD